MNRWIKWIGALAFVAAIVAGLAGASIASTTTPNADYGNVSVLMTVGKIQGGERVPSRTYEMLVTTDGSKSQLLSGSRVPIPTTSFQTSQPPDVIMPMTSYTYQNVGFSAEVRVAQTGRGWVGLEVEVEDSEVASYIKGNPVIDTKSQRLNVVLGDGEQVEIQRENQHYLALTARRLN